VTANDDDPLTTDITPVQQRIGMR